MRRQKPAEDAPEKRPCLKCKVPLSKGQWRLVTDGVACRDQRSCRARCLAVELGIDLYTQYPRERLLYEMDIRPPDYQKTGWKPIFTEDERVMAGWLYYSWCFPVSMAYAVQIDLDDEIMRDRYAQPLVMTQERLGQIIGLSKNNMCRATNRLAERKKLRIDDGMVYPTPKPEISKEARKVLSTENLINLGDDPETIPLKYRRRVDDLLSAFPDDVLRSENLARVLRFCTDHNEALKVIRSVRNQGIEGWCTETATLLSRPITWKTITTGDPPPVPANPVPEVAQMSGTPPPVNDHVATQPPPPLDEIAVVVAQVKDQGGNIGKPAAGKLLEACRAEAPECSVEDVVAVINQIGNTVNRRKYPNVTGVFISQAPGLIAAEVAQRQAESIRLLEADRQQTARMEQSEREQQQEADVDAAVRRHIAESYSPAQYELELKRFMPEVRKQYRSLPEATAREICEAWFHKEVREFLLGKGALAKIDTEALARAKSAGEG